MADIIKLPLFALRNLVVFPGTRVGFDAVRKRDIRAVEAALSGDKEIFLVAQEDITKEHPSMLDLYKIGVVARIAQTLPVQGGVMRVVVDGLCRARLCGIDSDVPYSSCSVELLSESGADDRLIMNEGFMRSLSQIFDRYFDVDKRMPGPNFILTTPDMTPEHFANVIATNVNLNYRIKQNILEKSDLYERIELLITEIGKEIRIIEVQREIDSRVRRKIEENQREYFLREQLKEIEAELGEKDGGENEAEKYREMLKSLHLKKEIDEKLQKEITRFERLPVSAPENSVLRGYLDLVLSLPWNKKTKESINIEKARMILDEDHYGLEKPKERVLEYLAVRSLTKGKTGSILCLVGPPGTGKTSIAKSIARALNRKYVRISVGGVHDEADIRGHRKTYIGAMPGRIISAVSEAKVRNPLILLDEIDKMGKDYKGDPSAALLEVLDSEQNSGFRDHFVELPFDLSEVMFITTANTLSTIPEPLLDRIEVIEISGYTASEKKCIAGQYLLPRQRKKCGLDSIKLTVDEKAIEDIINHYTRESGVRGLEREMGRLMRRIAKKVLDENKRTVKITAKNLTDYMGRHRFLFDAAKSQDEIGIVRGLAWTSVGGETLSVEVNVMPGNGSLELTGNLGDVMKESAMAAVSYIRTRCKALGIYEKFYKTCDIHIHVPEGAVPKDGPSAGITIATAIASALTGFPVKSTVAMTGEITLRGRVLPIGGLKEKTAAAYRAGVKTVIIPHENSRDIDELTKEVRDNLKIIPVKTMDEVLEIALAKRRRADRFIIPEE